MSKTECWRQIQKKIRLEDVLDWIRTNMTPYDVFHDADLTELVEKEIITYDPSQSAYCDQLDEYFYKRVESAIPGDPEWEWLTEWAENNNYVPSKVPADDRRYG